MSYNFRKKQIEKLKFAMKINFGIGNLMVVLKFQYFQGSQVSKIPPKGSNITNL